MADVDVFPSPNTF